MARILSIETSTTAVCSVAIHEKGELVSLEELIEPGAHSGKLIGLIDKLLSKLGMAYGDLDAIAVSEGPGSYTGLRIGVSTAKGLAFALDKPLISVNTLQSIASIRNYEIGEFGIAVMDARRMEVFSQTFGKNQTELGSIKSVILEKASFSVFLELGKVYFSGDAVEKVKSVIKHPNAFFVGNSGPSAGLMGRLAFFKFLERSFVDLAYFVPNYSKEFKALDPKKNPLLQ
jgi:tRNA threonylcarbamoyladenosine biosynthesis protein TsaB